MDANAEASEPKSGGRSTWLVGAIVAAVFAVITRFGKSEDTNPGPVQPLGGRQLELFLGEGAAE